MWSWQFAHILVKFAARDNPRIWLYMSLIPKADDTADRNWRRFVIFRVLFNARFYYPVLAVLFLDLGLTATEYTLLNFAWALAIVFTDLPAGVLADRIGDRKSVV